MPSATSPFIPHPELKATHLCDINSDLVHRWPLLELRL